MGTIDITQEEAITLTRLGIPLIMWKYSINWRWSNQFEILHLDTLLNPMYKDKWLFRVKKEDYSSLVKVLM